MPSYEPEAKRQSSGVLRGHSAMAVMASKWALQMKRRRETVLS
jgi:hypothetical protein